MVKDPRFKTWLEESDYWDNLSMEELITTSEPVDAKFIDRRPRKAISLRVEEDLISASKIVAADVGVGYQTLFRMWIREGLRRHRQRSSSERPARKTKSAA